MFLKIDAIEKLGVKTLMQNDIVKIKKYGNRRFYSSADKSYITILDIENRIKKGYKLQITDADTETDITAEVLTQILLDQGRAQHFPIELLEGMIRVNEKSLQSFWTPLLAQNMNLFTQMSEMALNNMKALVGPFAKKKKAAKETKGPKN